MPFLVTIWRTFHFTFILWMQLPFKHCSKSCNAFRIMLFVQCSMRANNTLRSLHSLFETWIPQSYFTFSHFHSLKTWNYVINVLKSELSCDIHQLINCEDNSWTWILNTCIFTLHCYPCHRSWWHTIFKKVYKLDHLPWTLLISVTKTSKLLYIKAVIQL